MPLAASMRKWILLLKKERRKELIPKGKGAVHMSCCNFVVGCCLPHLCVAVGASATPTTRWASTREQQGQGGAGRQAGGEGRQGRARAEHEANEAGWGVGDKGNGFCTLSPHCSLPVSTLPCPSLYDAPQQLRHAVWLQLQRLHVHPCSWLPPFPSPSLGPPSMLPHNSYDTLFRSRYNGCLDILANGCQPG